MTVKRYAGVVQEVETPPQDEGYPGYPVYVRLADYARLEQQHAQLRAALVGVLGRVDGREELTELRVIVKHTAPDADTRDVSLAAIDALLATLWTVQGGS